MSNTPDPLLHLRVRLATDEVFAGSHLNRSDPQFPFCPATVYMALVASLHRRPEGPDSGERSALLFLEGLNEPPLIFTPDWEATEPVQLFVPWNYTGCDPADQPEIAPGLILRRKRVERVSPSVTLAGSELYYSWRCQPADAERHRVALDRLAGRISRLGRSLTPVSLGVVPLGETVPEANWLPNCGPRGRGRQMRVPYEGALTELERRFTAGQRPGPFPEVDYFFTRERQLRPAMTALSSYGEMVVFRRVSGPSLPIDLTLPLIEFFRSRLMELAALGGGGTAHWLVSGLEDGVRKVERPHLAYVPLPDIDHRHASGDIKGVAVVFPRDLENELPEEYRTVSRVLMRFNEQGQIPLGPFGEWRVERVVHEAPLHALRPGYYCRPSRRWATVTPIVFDRCPDPDRDFPREAAVAWSCRPARLPAPVGVAVVRVPPFRGVPPAGQFVATRTGGPAQSRKRAHAVVEFPEPVEGPILLGRLRHFGLGLLRPVESQDA